MVEHHPDALDAELEMWHATWQIQPSHYSPPRLQVHLQRVQPLPNSIQCNSKSKKKMKRTKKVHFVKNVDSILKGVLQELNYISTTLESSQRQKQKEIKRHSSCQHSLNAKANKYPYDATQDISKFEGIFDNRANNNRGIFPKE